MQQTPYQLLGGEPGIRALAEAFYDIMDELPEAATIRAMHAEDLGDIKQKLFEYLSGWLGGPPLYLEKRGTVCLTSPHAPYRIGPDERDQWLLCMEKALERIGASDEVRQMVRQPFFRIADTIRNKDSSGAEPRDPSIIAIG